MPWPRVSCTWCLPHSVRSWRRSRRCSRCPSPSFMQLNVLPTNIIDTNTNTNTNPGHCSSNALPAVRAIRIGKRMSTISQESYDRVQKIIQPFFLYPLVYTFCYLSLSIAFCLDWLAPNSYVINIVVNLFTLLYKTHGFLNCVVWIYSTPSARRKLTDWFSQETCSLNRVDTILTHPLHIAKDDNNTVHLPTIRKASVRTVLVRVDPPVLISS